MKKIYFGIVIIIFFSFSCNPYDGPVTPPPICDNTINNCFISLDWSQAYYICNAGAYSTTNPPLATSSNYLYTASALTDIVNITNSNIYLCQMNVKNDEQAQTACTNPATLKLFWKTAGVNQLISTFSHFDSDVTIDYYEPVDICGDGRPYFVGAAGLPPGVTSWTPIAMYTQPSYKP